MKPIVISSSVLEKLRVKHNVTPREIEQCFENRVGNYLADEKEEHKTDPETLWFVAQTNRNRLLKIAFIFIDGNIHIKTAFEPKQSSIDLYDKFGK